MTRNRMTALVTGGSGEMIKSMVYAVAKEII